MYGTVNQQMDLIRKGTVEIIPEDELVKKIEHSIKTQKPLRIKLGCDPSKPDLHLGHAVVLNKLREFQEFGHTAVLIIGDFTGMIGDPSGKKKTRPQLTFEQTREYGQSYFEQASKILNPDKTEIRYNSEWLSKLDLHKLINIMSRFTLQRIIERDDFTNRLKEEQEIALHEILYPIMQGYDSYAINSDVELGGTDQKFNNLIGRDLQRRFGLEPQVVVLMPLLEGTDGSEKMSKSLNNYIGITEPPNEIFGKAMSIPDVLIYKYFLLCTRLPVAELQEIKKGLENPQNNPRDFKRKLAYELVKLYYGENEAKDAMAEFDRIFVKKDVPSEIEEYHLTADSIKLVNLMTETQLAGSNAQARRLIEQGGVSINGKKITDINFVVKKGKEQILKVGKRKFLKILS
ncbi:MAG: tyrosine--tRNA ligase [Ignavibacteria bacterium]